MRSFVSHFLSISRSTDDEPTARRRPNEAECSIIFFQYITGSPYFTAMVAFVSPLFSRSRSLCRCHTQTRDYSWCAFFSRRRRKWKDHLDYDINSCRVKKDLFPIERTSAWTWARWIRMTRTAAAAPFLYPTQVKGMKEEASSHSHYVTVAIKAFSSRRRNDVFEKGEEEALKQIPLKRPSSS